MDRRIHFFVGTLAELIKVAPVIAEAKRQGLPVNVIASGQNDMHEPSLWALADHPGPDLQLSTGPRRSTPSGLAQWWAETCLRGAITLRGKVHRNDVLVVHGDTVSTLLGAVLGRLHGAKIAHVEAGLRSFDLLEPFPEEICRRLVTRIAQTAYAPGTWAKSNLRRHRQLQVVDTEFNTLADSLRAALGTASPVELPEHYYLFVLHRQETLLNRGRFTQLVQRIALRDRGVECVFVLHQNTADALRRFGLMEQVENAAHVRLIERQPYIPFMRWLGGARFIVTDGGSNQEEAFYLGKPCLLLRSSTERREGLGENAVLSEFDPERIERFLEDPDAHARPPVSGDETPSTVIVHDLARTLRT